MSSKSLKLHIPEPCHEDWQAMLPQEKGRYCLACQKTVTDFTKMSDREIIDFFENKPTSVCGRFRPEQLNPKVIDYSQPVSRWKFYLLAFATITMKTIWTETLKAQTPTMQHIPVSSDATKGKVVQTDSTPVKPIDVFYTISGKVIDSTTHEDLLGVSVMIKGTNTRTITQINGEFKLDNVKMGDVLVFSFIGYTIKEFIISSRQPLSVVLNPDFTALSGYVVVCSYKPLHKRIYYRIKSWFK